MAVFVLNVPLSPAQLAAIANSNPIIVPAGLGLAIQLTATATLNVTGQLGLIPAPNGTITGATLILNGKVAFSMSQASIDLAGFVSKLGNPASAIAFALAGNDILTGSNIALPIVTDHLLGGAGNDSITGLAGKDVINGGIGAFDTVVYSEKTVGISLTLGGANVVLQQKTGVGGIPGKNAVGGIVEDLVSNIENIAGGKGQ